MNARARSHARRHRAHNAIRSTGIRTLPLEIQAKPPPADDGNYPPTFGEVVLNPLLLITVALAIFLALAAAFIGSG
jgi:hypothetical protein